MKTKDTLYVSGAIITSILLSSCTGEQKEDYNKIDPRKPNYNIGQIVIDDDNDVHSSKIDSIITSKTSELKNYQKENVTYFNDNTEWKGYVDLEKEIRQEYSQLPLRCVTQWDKLSDTTMSVLRKNKEVERYNTLIANTESSLESILDVKVDPLLQLADKYTNVSLPVYDKNTKHVFLYKIIFGEGGETEPQVDGSGSTKTDRKVRLMKMDLGNTPDQVLFNSRNAAGIIINQIDDLSIDFADSNYTYRDIKAMLDSNYEN